jgi:nitric oxide reductase subunit C
MGLGLRWLGIIVLAGTSLAYAQSGAPEAYDKKCKLCHSIKGEGGKQADKGGPLDGVGGKHDRAWFEKYLQDPKAVKPDTKMPKFKYTDEELKALVDYLLSLK